MSKFENVSIVREANIRFCQNGEPAAHPEALCATNHQFAI